MFYDDILRLCFLTHFLKTWYVVIFLKISFISLSSVSYVKKSVLSLS